MEKAPQTTGDLWQEGYDAGLDDAIVRVVQSIGDIAAAMPWYDESDPDYSEVIEKIRNTIKGGSK